NRDRSGAVHLRHPLQFDDGVPGRVGRGCPRWGSDHPPPLPKKPPPPPVNPPLPPNPPPPGKPPVRDPAPGKRPPPPPLGSLKVTCRSSTLSPAFTPLTICVSPFSASPTVTLVTTWLPLTTLVTV